MLSGKRSGLCSELWEVEAASSALGCHPRGHAIPGSAAPAERGAAIWRKAALPCVQLKAAGLSASPLCWARLDGRQAFTPVARP